MPAPKKDSMVKAVIFDIDGTLTPGISWTKLTLELGASVPDHLQVYENFKLGKLTYEESKKALIKLWQSSGPITKDRLTRIFESWTLNEESIPLFRYIKSRGCKTCLITGSLDLYAEVIAKRLGADFWYANTKLVFEEGKLVDFEYELDAGKKKLSQFVQFSQEQHLEPQECIVVGDDSNDIELFKLTGRGVAVESPASNTLEGVAWRKIKELAELKEILESLSS